MSFSFDLTREPWLPCLDRDGRPLKVGLYEALARAHELRAVEGATPLETAAVYRLLLAVLHRVELVPNAAAWSRLWEGQRWEEGALDRYLGQWQSRFDLFHPERPFYQWEDRRVQPWSVGLLFPGMQAAPFYNHEVTTGDLALGPAEAAVELLVAQHYGASGTRDPSQGLFFSAGTWSTGYVFFVEGENLFQTLAYNLLPYGEGNPRPWLEGTAEDRPA
nr:type I-E CRISPR-associated protein Cse1/CasA [Dehalococcoidales bacterium]